MSTYKHTVLLAALALLMLSTEAAKLKQKLDLPRDNRTDVIQYLLFTRSNSQDPYFLQPFDVDSVTNSGFDFTRPTFIQIHGYTNSAQMEWVVDTKDALLARFDANVISMDWSVLCVGPFYNEATANAYVVANWTASYLDWLNSEFGLDISTLHLTGHSLGAQLAGIIGHNMVNGKPGRVTGLDPAGPNFYDVDGELQISPTSGDFVDIIHTNGGSLLGGTQGLFRPLGHVDFYPNGGTHQTGCGSNASDAASGCSHQRAPKFWVESITAEEPNVFWSWQCADWATFSSGECDYSCDSGVCLQMGLNSIEGAIDGIYYLSTAAESPYALGASQLP